MRRPSVQWSIINISKNKIKQITHKSFINDLCNQFHLAYPEYHGVNRVYINAAYETLKAFCIRELDFSLNGYKDDAICLLKNEQNKWIVFDGDKGNKYDEKVYTKLQLALDDFFSRIAESDSQEKDLKSVYSQKLQTLLDKIFDKEHPQMSTHTLRSPHVLAKRTFSSRIRSVDDKRNKNKKQNITIKSGNINRQYNATQRSMRLNQTHAAAVQIKRSARTNNPQITSKSTTIINHKKNEK